MKVALRGVLATVVAALTTHCYRPRWQHTSDRSTSTKAASSAWEVTTIASSCHSHRPTKHMCDSLENLQSAICRHLHTKQLPANSSAALSTQGRQRTRSLSMSSRESCASMRFTQALVEALSESGGGTGKSKRPLKSGERRTGHTGMQCKISQPVNAS